MSNFKPIIIGTDINAYGVARSFHEAYGVKSLCLGKKPLTDTQHSKITDVEVHENFDSDDAVFLQVLHDVGERFSEKLLLIACGDGYMALVTRHREELEKRYVLNVISHEMQQRLENKKDFYEVCEQYGLDYPNTFIITYETRNTFETPFDFPVALKPNDSIAYLDVHFPDKKKAYTIVSEEELRKVVSQIYATEYRGELILQDFIPGDFSSMYVLNAYVNSKGKVTMMCLGKCLLDECLPTNIGNYNALVTTGDDAIYAQYQKFLEDIGYRGFANFDLKWDERDGKMKVFEINIRQGRSSYYMTTGGCNFVTFLKEDLIDGEDRPTYYHKEPGLWLYVDPSVLKKYCSQKDKKLVYNLLEKGFRFTQWYEKDRNLYRFLEYWRRRLSTIRYYPKFQPERE